MDVNTLTLPSGGHRRQQTLNSRVSGFVQSYYKALDGLVIEAGKTVAVNFDGTEMSGHFRDNPNSSYHKSGNAKTFTIQLAASGHAPVQIELKKDKGGAETAD